MPFDLYVGRAASFAAIRDSRSPISVEELQGLMSQAPATQKSESVYWVRHQQEDPWFAAEWRSEGHIVLSTSYSHDRFLRNLGDLFDQGLAIAGELNARLFEEVGGQEVTARNIDELMDPKGRYVALQSSTWRHTIELLDSEVKAPLEFPLGPVDAVSEFLVFHVIPERRLAASTMVAALARQLPGTNAELVEENAMYLVGADDGKPLAKVLLRPDGRWQIWPSHGRAPFSRIAPTVIQAAECIHAEAAGELLFRGQPFEEALRREVRARAAGLSVDFFTWTQAADAGATRP